MSLDWPRLFRYDHWATRTLLEYMRPLTVPDRPRQLLAHLLAAQAVWLGRIEAHPEATPVWPDLTLAESATLLDQLEPRLRHLSEQLTESECKRIVTYTNTKGESFQNSVADILQHVLFHGMHHRGQIATHLRQAGLEPPATDFIFAIRAGSVR
ncbi:MAG TPA: DinB family protein [Gemmatales bacterium]|nr:DinB family protein [Gemmatales bacterium]HMP61144.1 DinB family protein [Gemmatales bacterium]